MDDLLGRHFISLFLILLFAIRLTSQRAARDKNLRYFWMTVISCFLLVVQDELETLASLDPGLRFWRILLSVAGYFLRATAALGLVLVVIKPEQRRKAIWVPCIVDLAVCSTAFFSDIAFGFDENYAFYRGPLGYVAFIVPLFYLGMILWLTFRWYGDSPQKADQMILVICALFGLLSSLLDATHGGVRLHEAIMISSIFFYIFLRSYDVRRDSLTLLLNRQSLYDDCASMDQSLCAAGSLDMNELKIINETRGSQAGDEALKKIGEILQGTIDSRERAYRIGGDEFVILFFHSDEKTIQEKLAGIRGKAAEAGYSVAYGYAMREGNEKPEILIRRADMNMFGQKARYYQDRRQDLRQASGEKQKGLSSEIGKPIENLIQPAAVYRFSNHRAEILAVSDGFCKLFGFPNRDHALHILDQIMYREIHPDDRERVSGAMLRFSEGKEELDIVYRTGEGLKSGYRVIHARGEHDLTETEARIGYVWYMDEGTYSEDDEGKGNAINQALSRALHEESILHSARHDNLTGLPNLAWFFELYEARKTGGSGEEKQPALLYINLTGMKHFNHQYGFAEGDQLLKAFGGLLIRIFGKENCCHIAADHFAAGAAEEAAEEMIRTLFEEARAINGGKTLPVRVGIYSASLENVPVSSAYDRAKMACDAIRKTDASAYHCYDRELQDEVRKHQYLIENIDRAVSEKWIKVYYQPIVRAVNEKICDEEALARWIDPVEGFLSPADFIPHLEKAGLIYKLDLCVLEQVLDKMKTEAERGTDTVPHSINLSRSDFEACDIVEEFRKRVDAAGIPRDKISVEITESIIGSNFDFMKKQIERFHELGFPVWMDDFGSGYSSLTVLRSIPFDLIKFDMSFMRTLDEGDSGKIILTELMKMAASLRVDTVCEGVETEAQVRFLQEIGCSKLQGYYYSKPLPPEQMDSIRISRENPAASSYYETIGRTDLYDLGVITGLEKDTLHRTFNTLPMAIVEIKGDTARFARSTPSYRDFIQRFFGVDMTEMTKEFARFTAPFMKHVVKVCCEQGNTAFFDEKMQDGSVIHSFARQIGMNVLNGNRAVAVAVLSISGPEDDESYADIAQALTADYYSICVADLDTEQFTEYKARDGKDGPVEERRGAGFFEAVRQDALTRVYEDDRAFFLNWFTRENIIRRIDEQEEFAMIIRVMDHGSPVYVNLKISRIEGKNKIILGVSSIDSLMKQQIKTEEAERERDALARVMALTEDYLCLYSVDPESGRYVEYTATPEYETFGFDKEGDDFFRRGIIDGRRTVCGEDYPRYQEEFTKEKVLREIREKGRYTLSYRLMIQDEPTHVSLKIAPFQNGKEEKWLAGVRKWRIRRQN